jgi:hypothetical protein
LTIISDVFAFRVDIWDAIGNSIVERIAGVDDFEVAEAAGRASDRGQPTPARGVIPKQTRTSRGNIWGVQTVFRVEPPTIRVPETPPGKSSLWICDTRAGFSLANERA